MKWNGKKNVLLHKISLSYMGRKRKELPVVENVEITGVAAEGKSIARVDDMVVFIPYGAPGDVVNIKLDKKKRSYAEAHIVDMVKPSPDRVTPACEHFGVCGGCKWQHIPYESQLRYKRDQVVDALTRIAKVEIPEVNPTLGSKETFCYRNKLEYTFSCKCWITFEDLRRLPTATLWDSTSRARSTKCSTSRNAGFRTTCQTAYACSCANTRWEKDMSSTTSRRSKDSCAR